MSTGEIGVTAFEGGRKLTLETTRVSTDQRTVAFHRVDSPPLFAGMRQTWLDGSDDASGVTFDMCAGAGFGSKWLTLALTFADGTTIYEVVDMRQVFEQWITDRLADVQHEEPGS